MAKGIAFRGGNSVGANKLKKADLLKSKSGRIVSKVKSMLAKKRYASGVGKWTKAVQKARKEMGVTGFVAIKKGKGILHRVKVLNSRACTLLLSIGVHWSPPPDSAFSLSFSRVDFASAFSVVVHGKALAA